MLQAMYHEKLKIYHIKNYLMQNKAYPKCILMDAVCINEN